MKKRRKQKHVYEQFLSEENIHEAIKLVAGHHKDKPGAKIARLDINTEADYILKFAEYFHNPKHITKVINENSGPNRKTRDIVIPGFEETIVHHMIVNAMMPTLTRRMYAHSYSSIPGRGLHKCRKTVRKWIDEDPKNCKFFIQLDIKKFFPSINQEILMDKFRKDIDDNKFLHVIEEVLKATPDGLPLGFYTSHWFANYYLTDLDHFIIEDLHAVHYVRYMDDMVIFGSNKRRLHFILKSIKTYLEDELDLELKSNYQLKRFDYIRSGIHHGEFLDFVGFRFYRDRTTLRKSIFRSMLKKCHKIEKKNKFTIHDAHQMISYLGWVKWSDTFIAYKRYVQKHASFTKCKKKISQYDKFMSSIKKSLELNFKEVELNGYYV